MNAYFFNINFRRLVFFLLIGLISCANKNKTPWAEKGILDLREYDFSRQKNIVLNGEWEFYWNEFVPASQFFALDNSISNSKLVAKQKNSSYIKVPSSWNLFQDKGKKIGAQGFATYRLKILLPAKQKENQIMAIFLPKIFTAYRLYINGEEQLQTGVPAKNAEQAVPAHKPSVQFFLLSNDIVDVVFHVSNFNYARGGIRKSILLGTEESIEKYRYLMLSLDSFIIGVLLIMSAYYLGIFFLRKKMYSILFFSMFTFLLSMRIFMRGGIFVSLFIPSLPFHWQTRLEYLFFYLAIPSFYWFLRELFPKQFSLVIGKALLYITAFFSTLIFFTPPLFFTKLVMIFEAVTGLTAIAILPMTILALRDKEKGALITLISLFLLLIAVFNDILHTRGMIYTMEILQIGLLFWIFIQAFLLSLRFSSTYQEVEHLSKYLKKLNEANTRFVPEFFLSLLEKKNILDIQLGDNIEKRMVVSFISIHNFQEISQKLADHESFIFINSYLEKIGPVVCEHNGFIDKYLTNGFIAIFPSGADDMLKAGIHIQKQTESFNQTRGEDEPQIHIGIGSHIGDVMLGTIGDEERIDVTVISDTVNISSRLKDLTKTLHSAFMISVEVKEELKAMYHFRRLGMIPVKGRSKPLAAYEILDCYNIKIFNKRLQTLELFEKALGEFEKKKFASALDLFTQILQEDDTDVPAYYYHIQSYSLLNEKL